jgi:hypothetical protein
LELTLKRSDIEFVRNKQWSVVWWIAFLGLLVLLGVFAPKLFQFYQNNQRIQKSISELQQTLLATKPELVQPQADGLKNSQQVARLLQVDLNSVFTLVENIKEPNTRLRSLSIDTVGQSVRLEYEIDTMVRAASITAVLNAGYATGPWQLNGIVPSSVSNQEISADRSNFQATWSANLGKL